jgi:peptide/nickel transport system ATP-binding protein
LVQSATLSREFTDGAGSKPVLQLRNVRVVFHTYAGVVKALDGINLTLNRGETLGLVGESGCGKSVTAQTIVGLLPENAEVTDGEILLNSEDLRKKSKKEIRLLRTSKLAMIFQDPMTFLNPVLSIGEQLREVFTIDKKRFASEALRYETKKLQDEESETVDSSKKEEIRAKLSHIESLRQNPPTPRGRFKRKVLDFLCEEILNKLRLPDPKSLLKAYPHELSGGMRQRIMIAMAIARNPDVLIADEITTALDVTIQAQILELLRILRSEMNSTILIITHDLGVVADICDRVAVMYAGNVVEVAKSERVYSNPLHPYTQGLLKAVPRLTADTVKLDSIPGSVPDLIYPPSGCRFHPRCPYAWELGSEKKPLLFEAEPGHAVECHLYSEGKRSA